MTQLLLTPTLAPSPSGVATASNGGTMPAFCEQNRAMVATFLHTQGALLSMIHSIACQAVDGQGDMEQTLRNIELVAIRASLDCGQMAVAVGSIRTQPNL